MKPATVDPTIDMKAKYATVLCINLETCKGTVWLVLNYLEVYLAIVKAIAEERRSENTYYADKTVLVDKIVNN